MNRIFLKMKLNNNSNKILVSPQPMKRKLTPSTSSGKTLAKILNLVWCKIGKTEINSQSSQGGTLPITFLN
jgi:hypothetical protein